MCKLLNKIGNYTLVILLVVAALLIGISIGNSKEEKLLESTQEITQNKSLKESKTNAKISLEDNTKEINEEIKTGDVKEVNEIEENNQTQEFRYFDDAKEEIISYVESEDFASLKSKGKFYITTGIDFIFYDKPINGIYFKNLTTKTKETIIKDLRIIDEHVMEYYPDYKESIGTGYKIVADFLNEKYLSVLDSIKEYLGDENYEAIGKIKDKTKDDLVERKNKLIDFISDKYNNWKNKN